MPDTVQEHYASEDIVGRILAAIGGGALTPDRIYPFDQLHGRELLATRDHVGRLALTNADHVLDIGSGIGGPARFIAAETGARVTGVDLTPEFVEAATELSARSGLADLVSFVPGDATALPFEAETFDAAVCFYVGMNLPDKAGVLAEAFRVLRPGARLIWTEAVLAGAAAPVFPLPWAAEPSVSFLVTREALTGLVKGAGFAVMAVLDETAEHVDLAKKRMQSGAVPPPLVQQANSVVLGPDFGIRRKSYIDNLAAGQIASLLIEAEKPWG